MPMRMAFRMPVSRVWQVLRCASTTRQVKLIREMVSDSNGFYGFADCPPAPCTGSLSPEGYLFSVQVSRRVATLTATSTWPRAVRHQSCFPGQQRPDLGCRLTPPANRVEQAAEPDKEKLFLPLVFRTGLKVKPPNWLSRNRFCNVASTSVDGHSVNRIMLAR